MCICIIGFEQKKMLKRFEMHRHYHALCSIHAIIAHSCSDSWFEKLSDDTFWSSNGVASQKKNKTILTFHLF